MTVFFTLCISFFPVKAVETNVQTIPPDSELLSSVYSGDEQLIFDVRWLGLKAGELHMFVQRLAPDSDRYSIKLTAKTTGLLDLLYPVEDRFETIIEGNSRLPVFYAMHQKEGRRVNYKETRFDQNTYRVVYKKNEEKENLMNILRTEMNQ